MRNFFTITILLLSIANNIIAQCGNGSVLTSGSLTPPGVGLSTTLIFNSGQYVLAKVEAGANYQISTCGGTTGGGPSYDTQLTVYDDFTGAFIAYNDDYCGLQSTVNFTPSFCGYVRVLLHQYSCNGSNLPWNVTMTQNTAGTPLTYTLSAITSQTNVSCFGNANGAAFVQPSGGVRPFQYSWAPSGGTDSLATGLAPGVYTCTAYDHSCNGTIQTFTITEPTALTISSTSQTNVACFGGSTGAASVTISGGTTPYSYDWNPGTPAGDATANITGLTQGTYSCAATDGNGCTVNSSLFTISQPTSALVTPTAVTNVLCNGGTGSATITASGGTGAYTYLWSNGSNTSVASSLVAGVYTSTVIDANGCASIKNITVTQPTAISTSTAVTNVLCNGGTGSATITASGGTGAYTYLWSNGASTSVASNLLAGVYSATVTDANNCKSIRNVTVTQPNALTTSTAVANVLCNGGIGSATITVSGGTGPYTYLWSNGVNTSVANNLLAGIYTTTITDANNCISSKSVTITEPTLLVASSSASSILCHGGVSTVTVSATDGTPSYVGVGTFTAAAGVQTYTVTDANGCAATTSLTITEPTLLVASSSASSILCHGGVSTVTVSATDGTPSYVGVGTFTAAAGVQTYTVTDANGCVVTTSLSIIEPAPILSSQTITLCAGQSVIVGSNTYTAAGTYIDVLTAINTCDSIITTNVFTISSPVITVNSGSICSGASFTIVPNGASTYTYSSGSNVVNPLSDATYTVSGTDANGCVSSIDAVSSVTVNGLPNLVTTTTNFTICAGETSTLTVSGATTYTWSTTENSSSISVSPIITTTYTVDGTDVNGCISSANVTQDVSACVGINELSNDVVFVNAYPNPNDGLFYIDLYVDAKILVMNTLGQTIISKSFVSGKHVLDIHEYSEGVYFVRVISGVNEKTIKVIKK